MLQGLSLGAEVLYLIEFAESRVVSEKKSNATFAHKRYKNVIYIFKALEAVQEYTVLEAAKNRNLYLKKKLAV